MEEFTTKMTETEATGEVLINKAEFDAAMKSVMKKMCADPDLKGVAGLLIPLAATTFAGKMADILFSNKED